MSYRQFLENYYKKKKKEHFHFSYSSWSKRCGFKSKSLIKEIISGKKRITPKTFYPILESLEIDPEFKKTFTKLVLEEEKDCPIPYDEKENLYKLKTLKKHIFESNLQKLNNKFLIEPHSFIVYAALGSKNNPLTIKDIIYKTGLPYAEVKKALDELILFKYASEKNGLLWATSRTLLSEKTNASLKKYFIHNLNKLIYQAEKNFNSHEKLFYTMSLSVDRRNLREMKSELKALIDKYTDKYEDTDGQTVITICVSLT